jgi:crotonobetainyl-CoA:carnitine CoA-transferase CaiB-like acyl-CoA transferase
MTEAEAEPLLPLSGRRVVDLTRNVAGPYAAMILAELGADVVKVEAPGRGDDTRDWGPPFWNEWSSIFLSLNRNKRAITLDLKKPSSREVMHRLVASADVLIESFRAGWMQAAGYGYDWAAEINPALIYCSLTSYGDRGPLRSHPGYDPLMQAVGGIMSVTGHEGTPPVRVGVSLIDMGTGMWSALAILAALVERATTGRGRHLTTALYETALTWMTYHLTSYWGTGQSPRRRGSGVGSIAPYQAFATTDGHLVIAAGNDELFAKRSRSLDHPEWARDPRWRRNSDRVRNAEALREAIEAVTATRSSSDLSQRLLEAGVPCGPVRDAEAVATDPQTLASGIVQHLDMEGIPDFRSIGLPFVVDGVRAPLRTPPPRLGQHNHEILAELGFAAEAIRALTS